MTSERWHRVESLYHAAQAQPPGDRLAFLAKECAGDESLYHEVESLLAQSDGGFLDGPAVAALSRAPGVAAGQRLGVYEIVSPLGAGGMGEVYRARDTVLPREVAIKILPPVFASDPGRLARFEREARVLASLNNPHIAAIHGVEPLGPSRALVLELVEGPTLADRIAEGPIAVAAALRIAGQIADALDAAHEQGIVHRDLKPANVKLRPDGIVKVLDFGLAKVAEPDAAGATVTVATRDGAVLGTAAYMSPEQARAEAVDKRTDIWAFGCVLYEMLSGKTAFAGETASDVIANILQRAPDWAVLPRDTPTSVRRLIERCLEKDRRQRLRDIGDVSHALDDLSPPATSTTLDRKSRAALVVPWLLLAATFGSLLLWYVRRPPSLEAVPVMRAEAVTMDPGYSGEPALSRDGRLLAFAADRSGAGNTDIYIQQTNGGNPLRLTDDPADDSAPDLSPEGSQVAFRSERNGGGVFVVPALGGAPRLVAAGGRDPRFSPDGTRLAYWTGTFRGQQSVRPSEVHVVALGGGAPERLMPGFPVANTPVWSPDGNALLVLGRRDMNTSQDRDFDWWFVPLDGTAPQRTGLMGLSGMRASERILSLAPGPWTSQGLLLSRRAGLWRVPLSPMGRPTGQPRLITQGVGTYSRPAVSRDGRIVFGSVIVERVIERLPLGTKVERAQELYRDGTPVQWRASTTRDGSTIVFERINGSRHEIWSKHTVTGEQRLIQSVDIQSTNGLIRAQLNATVSADGTRIAYSTTDDRENNAVTQGTGFVVETSGGVPHPVCQHCALWGFLADEQTLIATDRDRAVQFITQGKSRDIVVAGDDRIDRPSVAPNETAIAFRIVSGAMVKTYIVPLGGGTSIPRALWMPIDEPTITGRPCGWSPDSSTLYLLLDTDGFRDLWGQRVAQGRPIGTPFVVRHLHSTIGVSTSLSNAVTTQGFLYEALRQRGNIWQLLPEADSPTQP